MEYSGRFLRSSPKVTIHLDDESAETDDSVQHPGMSPMATWVCSICYFSNEISSSYLEDESEMPVCKSCGVKAEVKLIEDSLKEFSLAINGASQSDTDGFRCSRCTFMNHPSLSNCEICGARLVSARLPPALATAASSTQGLQEPAPKLNGKTNVMLQNTVKLSFRGNGDKLFFEQLKQTLAEKPWKQSAQKKAPEKSSVANNDIGMGSGLHGLEMVGKQTRQYNQQVLGSALEDLQSLMQSAKEVAKLAESYAKKLEAADLKSESKDLSQQARQALRQSSDALGLNSSIVTKEMAQNDLVFHEELARQIAEYLVETGILQKEGGAMTLFDVFAYYNRARGISLISPQDLISACNLLDKLKLPIQLRKFKTSGVMVLQEKYLSKSVIVRQILEWLNGLAEWQKECGVSVQDVSSKFLWSPVVAIEEMEMAEEMGAICRDETMSGLRFFSNEIRPYETA